MKHINFDESTVLREFSKIAHKKDLVKTAQDEVPQPRGEIVQRQPGERKDVGEIETKVPGVFEDQLRKFPATHSLYLSGRVQSGTDLLKELKSADFKRFYKGWLQSPDEDAKRNLYQLAQKVKAVLKQLSTQVKQMPEQYQTVYMPQIRDSIGLLSNASSVKQAEERFYDVSGETGEELVEKAHPGGGTKTELTHSETDENLVETIVEQQERDKEVALSVPKGTYAALLNLADRLDKMGHTKAADKVDGIIKNKIVIAGINEAQRMKNDALSNLQYMLGTVGRDLDKKSVIKDAINKLRSFQPKSLSDMFSYLSDINSKSNYKLSDTISNLMSTYNSALMREKQEKEIQKTPLVSPEKAERDAKKERLYALHNKLRQMVGLSPKKDAPFDKQLAHVLRTRYPEAWKSVKNREGLSAVMRAVRDKNVGVAKKEKAAPPKSPMAPKREKSREVVKEQMITKMYHAAMKGLKERGIPNIEDAADYVMRIIRMNANSPTLDVATKEGALKIWEIVKRRLNTDFPPQ